MALSKDIDRPLYQGDSRVYDVAATTTIYKGGLVSWNNSDGVRPFAVANTSDRIVGVAEDYVDNSAGAAGDLTCSVRLGGTYWFKNDTTDTILEADIGDLAYGFDDETVRQYDSLKANIPVGVIVAVDATKGVMVAEVGEHPTPSEIHSVSITFAGASTVKTSTGDLSLQSTDDDVVIALGDAAGAKKLKVVDSAAAEVFAVDSNGGVTCTALNVDGTVCLIPHAATATGGPPTQVEIAAAFGAAADGAVGVYDDTTPGVLYLCAATAARTWHYVAMTIGA